MANVFETMPGGYDDRFNAPIQRYYPGTYFESYPRQSDGGRFGSRAYRTYAPKEHHRDGFDYVTTREPFQPEHDYYHREYKRPYYYRDNRLYHAQDPVRKYYDGSGNVTVTVVDGGGHNKDSRDYTRYTGSQRGDPRSIRDLYSEEPHKGKHAEVEVGYLIEHLASFDISSILDEDLSQAEKIPGKIIEETIETLRTMDQKKSILPLRCYMTYKDGEIQVLSDKELTVLEWIKYDDVRLVSAELNQLSRYKQILLIRVNQIVHLFCPLGDLKAEDIAENIRDKVSKRQDSLDEQSGSRWQEDRSNNRYLLNDQTLQEEADTDFYDKYTMQLYGRATRDYVARNDKELTVMSGERVEIQSTRGRWWLARTSNGNSGYVPSDCLESYVNSPAGLPRTTLPSGRPRDFDSVSEHGSVVSLATSRHRDSGRDYHEGRGDRDYDRRDYERRDRYDRRDDRSRDNHDNFDTHRFTNQGGHSMLGTQQNFGKGFGTGTGLGEGIGFGPGLGTGVGNNFGTGLTNLSSPGLSTGLNVNAAVGTGFNTVGPSSGFSTVSSATAAGLFPQGFTPQLQGSQIDLTGSVRGNPLLAAQTVGTPTIGAPMIGTPALGVQNFGGQPLGVQNFGGQPLGVQNIGGQPLGAPTFGISTPTIGMPTLATPGSGARNGFKLM